MEHSFDVEIAREYGVPAAVILHHLYFWIVKSKADGRNFKNGRYWTYSSINAMLKIFPYYSKNTISRTMEKLEEDGLIITGVFNEIGYDRTKWYALTDLGESICSKEQSGDSHLPKVRNAFPQNQKSIYPKSEMDLPKVRNGFTQSQKPIPDILTDIYTYKETDNKKTFSSSDDDVCSNDTSGGSSQPEKRENKKPGTGTGAKERIPTQKEANELFERLWKKYPNKRGKGSVSDKKKRDLLAAGEEQITRCIERYIEEHDRLREEGRFCPEWKQGSTFFNSGYIDYLDENFCQEEAKYEVLEEPEEPEAINLWEVDDETFERLMKEKNAL